LAASQVSAFTNGSLVPSYICNPTPDGLPKAFAQLLPYTRKNAAVIAFDANKNDNDNNVPLLKQTSTSLIGNSAYILASFHDSLNNLNAVNGNGIQVTLASGKQIIAGQANQLTLNTGSSNVQLLGVLAYARDANGVPEGSYTDKGTTNTFVQFAGCGTNKQGQTNGIIQQTGVSATNTYTNLFYNAPANAQGTVTLAGLSVTKAGFGVWNFTFPVQAAANTGNTGAGAGAGASTTAAAGGSATTLTPVGTTAVGKAASGAATGTAKPCAHGGKHKHRRVKHYQA